MSVGFLTQMAQGSAERVARAKSHLSETRLRERAVAAPAPVPLSLTGRGFDVIAELKLRSPAAGALRGEGEDIVDRVGGYARGGAAAVSVLTEPTRFDGSMRHLELAAHALRSHGVPAMRKDFLVDPYQVLEARVAGAGGVLVILRMLAAEQVASLLDCARDMRLFVLLEAFDERDIEHAHALVEARGAAAGPERLLVGVNCRDLATLQVVPGRLEQLAPLLPARAPRVAESGVTSPADAARVAAAGYDLALVGSALMTSPDPDSLLADMLARGREARS